MKISLKYLILLVALFSVALTLFSSISSGYKVNQQILIDNTLETNRVYAQKLATTTDNHMKSTLQILEYSSKDIANYLEQSDARTLLADEAKRLFEQLDIFNSVIITSAMGEIIAASPETLDVVGKQVTSPGGRQALAEKKPMISMPFNSMTNRLIVFLSYPIFDGEGTYQGYVGGSIYLLEKNILNELLGEHFYQDGSYVFVVDEKGRILYHPNKDRIGDVVPQNAVVSDIMNGKSGAKAVSNTENIEMLAGYAYMPTTKWGVISQRPTEAALAPSNDLRNQMIFKTLPMLLISIGLIFLMARFISAPLQRLAEYAKSSTQENELQEIQNVRAWYYEAIQLENALVKSLVFFKDKVNFYIHQSTVDPLTGLVNRRAMDEKTKKWVAEDLSFSIILFDIDRFKRVNDTYGHAVGDEVLKYLAKEIRAVAREQDVCCRFGGEEFVLLLPNTLKFEAFEVAEQLRKKLETTISPCGEVVTISSGIASYPEHAEHIMSLIEIADGCLYEAKNAGRNRSIMADCNNSVAEALISV
ncbi:sensor domain-containing diguanylate cyclase [Sporosarcina sp. 179-K 3D1 HS]|uniref:sensor domain-containing diguanylate cyclase n=1 Tax=Sporosarcina sp. 179-K 3D1 HS TaxID=3232169 RepID=UPI0039A22FA7